MVTLRANAYYSNIAYLSSFLSFMKCVCRTIERKKSAKADDSLHEERKCTLEEQILILIGKNGTISRAELEEETGFSKSS